MKSPDAFRTISEVADDLEVPQHVLRFWESKFSQIKPMKRGGGRRYYRPGDVDLLRGIRHLLYGEGYTIKGVQRILREQGQRHVITNWQEVAVDDCDASVPVHVDGGDPDPGPDMILTEDPDPVPEKLVGEPLVAEEQISQLKTVLSELEACRQLLDKAS